ncbi:MAG: class I SAM-dependent methyltransferase [Planctomycetota bacterium]
MSDTSFLMTEAVQRYLTDVVAREPEPLAALRARTKAEVGPAGMLSSPEQGRLLGLLAGLAGVGRYLEIGTFTGYSALWIALTRPQARLTCLDVSEEFTRLGVEAWRSAGVDERVDLRIGPAMATLDGMLESGEHDAYDLAFIDADKINYPDYYERCMLLVRPGGLIAIDNTLWDGRVADPSIDDPDTHAIRRVNEHVFEDSRVDGALIPIGDGLTLARKR